MPLKLPVQAVVNRLSEPPPVLERFLVDFPTEFDEYGTPTESDTGVPFGQGQVFGLEPGDPGWFPPQINPRLEVCRILSAYAVARCVRGGGYF